MKKYLLISLFFTIQTHIILANSYKIIFLNAKQIYVEGKLAKVGDILTDRSVVTWTKERQAMKIIDIDSNQRFLMVANDKGPKKLTVVDILTSVNHLSTHSQNGMSPYDILEGSIDSHYNLLDSIHIPTDIVVNDNNYFTLSYRYGDARITKKIKYVDGNLIIDKTIFDVDNKSLVPRDISITINYVIKKSLNPIYIKDNIKLTIIPEKID